MINFIPGYVTLICLKTISGEKMRLLCGFEAYLNNCKKLHFKKFQPIAYSYMGCKYPFFPLGPMKITLQDSNYCFKVKKWGSLGFMWWFWGFQFGHFQSFSSSTYRLIWINLILGYVTLICLKTISGEKMRFLCGLRLT